MVARTEAGRTLAAVLRGRLQLPWDDVRRLIQARCVLLAGAPCVDPNRRLAAGQRLEVKPQVARREEKRTSGGGPPHRDKPGGSSLDKSAIVFVDDQIVVVEKPADLTTMRHAEEAAEFGDRGKRFLPPTLADLLPPLVGKGQRVRPVHRLDKETTGLVVFARTVEAERHLGQQFRAHTVERHYLALVRGQAVEGRIESWLARDRGDGRRGSSREKEGQRAVTHVRIVERLGDFTLVECRLETGRTHQVRIHLGEAGTPLCGDRLYDRPLHGRPLPDGSGARRVMLHAVSLGLVHPKTDRRQSWSSPLPDDMQKMLIRLRQAKPV